MKLVVFPTKEPEGQNACEILTAIADDTPPDTKLFVLRYVDGNIHFHTANISIGELNLGLDQAKKYILEGGFV